MIKIYNKWLFIIMNNLPDYVPDNRNGRSDSAP